MMKVQISVVGIAPRPDIEWPEDWPVPTVGDEIEFDAYTLFVRHVVWYPNGDLESESKEPFVYVVVGTQVRS